MATLLTEIKYLKAKIIELENKIKTLQKDTDDVKAITPYSKVGGVRDRAQSRVVEPSTGLGGTFGSNLAWNDTELKIPPYGQKPIDPTRGYNKHFHSRYSGGAFDWRVTEIVEFDTDWTTDSDRCPHCQQLFRTEPPIKKDDRGQYKISTLEGNTNRPNMVWDKYSQCWRFYAVYARDDIEEEA